MYKIIVGGKIHQSGIDLLETAKNFEVTVLPDASQETLENNINKNPELKKISASCP